MSRVFAGTQLVPTPVIVFDPDKRVRIWNAAAETLYGWKASEVLGRPMPFVPTARQEESKAISERVRAGEAILDYDTVRLRRDGRQITVSLSLRPVLLEGSVWVVVSAIDVTERRRAQSELAESRRRYKVIAKALEEATRKRDQLMRLLVHDFKSPIAVVLASVRYLADCVKDADLQAAASDAIACADSLHHLTLNLLDVYRNEEAALVPKLKRIDLREVLGTKVERRKRASRSQIELRDTGGCSEITTDPVLLERVLRNLFDNAEKYGGGSPIEVSWRRERDNIEIVIADRGAGIPEAVRERIFDPYFRVQGSDELTARASHGLGLTFCKLAVEAQGGSIAVTENEPSGCRFVVTLPDAG